MELNLLLFIVGTTAEVIKIAPVALEMDRIRAPYTIILTGQHGVEANEAIVGFKLQGKIENVHSSTEGINSFFTAFVWFIKTLLKLLFAKKFSLNQFKKSSSNIVVIVQGDTLSTLLGCLTARFGRFSLVHIEAGLRSKNVASPFPEEIIRRIVSKFSCLNFAPSEIELINLKGSPGVTIVTNGNTALDTLKLVEFDQRISRDENDFCLVLLHRTEFLNNHRVLRQTFEEISEISKNLSIRVVADSMSKPFFLKSLGSNPEILVLDKMNYFEFHELLNRSSFVITDSGGLQEECAFLGKPCLIHRNATERKDGLLKNARISFWAPGELVKFASNYQKYRFDSPSAATSPTKIVIDELKRRNWLE